MFIFTAKLNKKKAVLSLILLAVILCAVIVLVGRHDRAAANATADLLAKTNEQRVAYLESFGWEVETAPVETQSIVIPRQFPAVYEEYNKIQKDQGFDLEDYGGLEATRYTYKVLNYPDYNGDVFADLIIYKNCIIAADIHSITLDGFIHGVEFPEQ